MKLLLTVICIVILLVVSCIFRCIVLNPFKFVYNSIVDIFLYIKHKNWRYAPCGELIAYVGLFGKGKTLSGVHKLAKRYKRYNNKRIYDTYRKKFVTQKVYILSNVHLKDIPYQEFKSLRQICDLAHRLQARDEIEDTRTLLYCFGDEFSVQMNSRNFKSNIDAQFLNTLLTCRHYNISLFYTAQRFNHVDALLRQVTQDVYVCDKLWRFQRMYRYDAYELENCTNPLLVKPISRKAWFVTNKDYNRYDTLACVENLEHSALTDDMIKESEILLNQAVNVDADTVVRTSRKAKKRKFYK